MLPIVVYMCVCMCVCVELLTERLRRRIQRKKKTSKFSKSVRLREQHSNRALNFPHKIRSFSLRAQASTCTATIFALHVTELYPLCTMMSSSVPYTIAIFHWIFLFFYLFYFVFLSQFTVVGDSVVALCIVSSSVTLCFLRLFSSEAIFLTLFSQSVVECAIHCLPSR